MSDDAQKNPLVKTLELYFQAMFNTFMETMGKSLPCTVESIDETGTIVTVNIEVQDPVQQFPQVTVPVLSAPWIRYPFTKGSPGLLVSSDVYLGGVSGLGGGVATLVQQGNLSSLGFLGLGGPGLKPTDDPAALLLSGPNGVIIRDAGDGVEGEGPGPNGTNTRIQADAEGNVVIFGALSICIDVGGYGQVITKTGPNSWRIDNYTQGADVTTNNFMVSPPFIPLP